MTIDADRSVLFSVELRPNRSGNARAIKILSLIIAGVMAIVALGFGLLGAWPVLGFMGLEFVALVALLHYNLRRSAIIERIAVTERQLHLERINPWGRRERWSFPRHWARVNLVQPEAPNSRLEIRSHGHVIAFGRFLTSDERREIAKALRRLLSDVCAPARPQRA